MSLFKIRDIWSTQVMNRNSQQDEFCLKLSPLDNLHQSQHFILVGTFSGTLSIFLPRARQSTNTNTEDDDDDLLCRSQHYEDLCLEYHVEQPILSIDSGNLTLNELDPYKQIVILHPQMVSVYSLTKFDSSSNKDTKSPITCSFDSWKLTKLINFNLKKTSFQMFLGKFIEHIETDVICIQMIDASFCFFNLSGILFEIVLPSMFIIPGPVVFLQSTYTMLTSASRQLYCFNLLSSSVSDNTTNTTYIPSNVNWSIVLEEPIFNMEKIEITSITISQHYPLSYIIILGRRRIFLLSESGCILFTRQIDILLKDLCIYGYTEVDNLTTCHENLSENNNNSNNNNHLQDIPTWKPRFLITTEKNQLLVFQGIEMLWSALLPVGSLHCSIPITPLFDSFNCDREALLLLPTVGINFPPGLIVLLNSNGRLTLSYLGTHPSDIIISNILKIMPYKENDNESKNIEVNSDIRCQLTNDESVSINKEMHQLNERISSLMKASQPSSVLLPSGTHPTNNQIENTTSIPKLKANIRLPSESFNNDEICFIDIIIEFPKKYYVRNQFTSVHLLTCSCPPIIISPNYIEVVSNPLKNHDFVSMNHIPNSHKYLYTLTCTIGNDEDDDGDGVEQNISRSFQLPLDMVVILMLYYTFTYTKNEHNSDDITRATGSGDTSSTSTHSITKCIKRCIKLPLHLCTSSSILVDKHQVNGKFSLYFQLLTKSNNNSMNIHISNLFPNLWSKICTTDLNDSSLKDKHKNARLCVSFCGFLKKPIKLDYCTYISVNCKKSLLKLQSNYTDTFWPIIQELLYYNSFIKKGKNGCLNGGVNLFSNDDYLHLVLSKKNSLKNMSNHHIPERSSPSVFSEYASQIEPLLNQLYTNLEEHVKKRIDLVNTIVKLTIQTKHFRIVQGEVINRIKNSSLTSLNGFDLLLKKDLTNLLNICDSIEYLTREHFQSGISVISLIILLSFICLFCIDLSSHSWSFGGFPLSCNLSVVENYLTVLEPASLVNLLNSTVLLDNIRGTELPSKISSNEMYVNHNYHLGLEEYLQAKINHLYEIISLKDQTIHGEMKIPFPDSQNRQHLGVNEFSSVKSIYELFYKLCKCFTSFNYKDILDLFHSMTLHT